MGQLKLSARADLIRRHFQLCEEVERHEHARFKTVPNAMQYLGACVFEYDTRQKAPK